MEPERTGLAVDSRDDLPGVRFGIEGHHVSEGNDPPIGPACRLKAATGLPQPSVFLKDSEELSLHRSTPGLAGVAAVSSAKIGDREGPTHANGDIDAADLGTPMPRYRVVLVEPREGGNVGAVARIMANLGYDDLVLVEPGSLEGAYRRAMQGRHVLKKAEMAPNLQTATADADLIVGTTAIPSAKEEAFHRQALTPWDLAARVQQVEGTVALIFGREDFGLYNEELDRMDALVHIPSRPDYPVMNLSHAVGILLYELYKAQDVPALEPPRVASGSEKERLHRAFGEFLAATDYSAHKRRRTAVLFRRLLGRAAPSKWEFHALMGVFRGATKAVRRASGSPGPGPSS